MNIRRVQRLRQRHLNERLNLYIWVTNWSRYLLYFLLFSIIIHSNVSPVYTLIARHIHYSNTHTIHLELGSVWPASRNSAQPHTICHLKNTINCKSHELNFFIILFSFWLKNLSRFNVSLNIFSPSNRI